MYALLPYNLEPRIQGDGAVVLALSRHEGSQNEFGTARTSGGLAENSALEFGRPFHFDLGFGTVKLAGTAPAVLLRARACRRFG